MNDDASHAHRTNETREVRLFGVVGLLALGVALTTLMACSSDDDEGGSTSKSADIASQHYTPVDAPAEPELPPGAGPPTTQPDPDEPEPKPDAGQPTDAGSDTGTTPADAGSDAAKDAAKDA